MENEISRWEKMRETYKKRRVFRIWLVGNPDELGYQKREEGGYGGEWFSAVSFVAYMIHQSIPDKDTFAGAFLEWFDDTLYLVESFPTGSIYTKPYKRFWEAVNSKDMAFLKRKHKIITDFAIPKDGEARKIFDRAVKVYKAILEKQMKKDMEIKQYLKQIEKLLTI